MNFWGLPLSNTTPTSIALQTGQALHWFLALPMLLTEGYINKLAVDANDEVIGYQFVKLGKMMEDIRHGKTPNEAYEKNVGTYGRFSKEQGAVKYIDPREE